MVGQTGGSASVDAADSWQYDNVYHPYEIMTGGPGNGYFGVVTRRASFVDSTGCKGVGQSAVPSPTTTDSTTLFTPGWADDLRTTITW